MAFFKLLTLELKLKGFRAKQKKISRKKREDRKI
jgi:hypothetical protein